MTANSRTEVWEFFLWLDIFEKYCNDFSFYPIGDERDKFNKDYLQKLDKELKNIDERYKIQILKKCDEIINQFADSKIKF